MWVLKIGGSLMHSPALRDWLSVLQSQTTQSIIIVPGGGQFADLVRSTQHHWQYDDASAHKMALMAMDMYAYMLHGLAPQIPLVSSWAGIKKHTAARTIICLPHELCQYDDSLPAHWDCSADSIAARIAVRIHASCLCIVKAKPLPPGIYQIQDLVQQDYLDHYFPQICTEFVGDIVSFSAAHAFTAFMQQDLRTTCWLQRNNDQLSG